ncbi:hypothetical protein Dsin_007741 [Dipteronia sinensis]|uniref:RNase H type-1 domain-containing protein n=1 Tax=Dipteronia sinensis TaxID=43782 RepID=A0AAE0B230_9ROSI|nr:hypothetical protein Dsin_007741 [Dipteronia sinensis]
MMIIDLGTTYNRYAELGLDNVSAATIPNCVSLVSRYHGTSVEIYCRRDPSLIWVGSNQAFDTEYREKYFFDFMAIFMVNRYYGINNTSYREISAMRGIPSFIPSPLKFYKKYHLTWGSKFEEFDDLVAQFLESAEYQAAQEQAEQGGSRTMTFVKVLHILAPEKAMFLALSSSLKVFFGELAVELIFVSGLITGCRGRPHSGIDKAIWGWSHNGHFSVKLTYRGSSLTIKGLFRGWFWMLLAQDVRLVLRTLNIFFAAAVIPLVSGRKSLERCKRAFDANFFIPQALYMIINHFIKDWLIANYTGPARDASVLLISWMPPLDGLVKLSIYGSLNANMGTITAGGVSRNHHKKWLKGFSINKGISSVQESKLCGMLEGLSMVWNSVYRNIIMESDFLSSVQLLSNAPDPNHPLFSIIQSYNNLISAEWHCNVVHVFFLGKLISWLMI